MDIVSHITLRWQKYNFLFTELVKRDFKKKYKRTVLGMLWSMLSPLLHLLVLSLIFTQFFGNTTPHFTIYIFAGLLVFNFFSESTNGGMASLMGNANIITKIKAPKYLFLLSKNVSTVINFMLTLIIFFIFVAFDSLTFSPKFLLLIYPIITLILFNIGVGLILSALYVFFRDIQYLYDIFMRLIMFSSAIFYPVSNFSPQIQRLFLLNPVFAHIHYFRLIVLYDMVPSVNVHLVLALYSSVAIILGSLIYKKYNYRFIYYM